MVTLRARILQIRDIPQGATVGYNGTWTAARPSRIATLAVGYADGWPRGISNRSSGTRLGTTGLAPPNGTSTNAHL